MNEMIKIIKIVFVLSFDLPLITSAQTVTWTGYYDPVVTINNNENELVKYFELEQNYPNPFNPTTHFEFGISKFEWVTLKVFDVRGKEVATLVNDIKQPGKYNIEFNGSNLASGVYFYKLEAGSFVQTKRMLLLK